jgi:hypothetical protein
MNKNFYTLLCFIVFTLAITSCKTAELGFTVVDLNGMVYDLSNRPVAHCEVSLGRWHKSSTDINGRFSLPKMPVGTYTITAHKKGFEDYSDEVIVREMGQIVYFRLPSQNQLLDLIDNALTENNFPLALELAERAYQIDKNNIEMLFYFATVKYKLKEYHEAIAYLDAAKKLGSRDIFVDKFILDLWRLQNAKMAR